MNVALGVALGAATVTQPDFSADFVSEIYYKNGVSDFESCFSFSRGSNATFDQFDSGLTHVDNDTIRQFDCGIILENSAVNHVRNSEDLTTSSWPLVNMSVINVGTIMGYNFYRIENVSSGKSFVGDQNASVLFSAGDRVSCSIVFRQNVESVLGTRLRLQVIGTIEASVYADVDLATADIIATGGGVIGEPILEEIAVGTYRLSLWTEASSEGYAYLRATLLDAIGHPQVGGHKADIAAPQISESFSSYIPTSGTAQTRNADELKIFLSPNVYDVMITYSDLSTAQYFDEPIDENGWTVPLDDERLCVRSITCTRV
ncbi:MAG: hypothetical protein ABJO67_16420 [Pseudoruegeria sp.]